MTSTPANQSATIPARTGQQAHSQEGTIGSVVAMCFVITLTIVGNTGIIVIFRVFKRVRKIVTNHFLINLAISDLIVALITMPFWIAYEIDRWHSIHQWIDTVTLERMWTFVDITCEASSIANLAVISIDRLYSVSNPFKHHSTVTPSIAHRLIFAVWGYAIAVASVYLLETKWKTAIISTFGFIVPLTIMVVCYFKIIIVVRSCRKRWSQNPDANKNYFGCIVNEYKTAKSLSVVMVVFVMCWMPFFVFSFLYTYCLTCLPWLYARPAIPAITKWLHYLNSALNPILYTMFNPSYRVIFRRLVSVCLRKEYQCTSYEAWYLGSRRVSTNSQRSLNNRSSYRNSYSSVHRPSCGSVTPTKNERSEIITREPTEVNDEVFVDGATNEGAATEETGLKISKGFPNRLAVRTSVNKTRVSFTDSDTVV
ncbi:tyramine/octopamine receptor-like [Dendronephthya gigantea]|uniref:tyramine/octopamine receptor-like n=1 Tax=Dendronephthya gigantea TaxID=151771 RepID=UPI00106C794E|nr:tyramine/octopamine receptor-like [Dendronephthya gigantea]XP_028397319.1 tyramine/octopamine receptor-like [Dendronephthya gigantea]